MTNEHRTVTTGDGREVVTYTRTAFRDPLAGYPHTLMMVPQKEMPDAARDSYIRHNRAIQAHARAKLGAMGDQTRDERAILSLLDGVEQFIGSADIDPWVAEFVVAPMLVAIGNALNLSLGRLDGGTLAEWISYTAERVGLNPDTDL